MHVSSLFFIDLRVVRCTHPENRTYNTLHNQFTRLHMLHAMPEHIMNVWQIYMYQLTTQTNKKYDLFWRNCIYAFNLIVFRNENMPSCSVKNNTVTTVSMLYKDNLTLVISAVRELTYSIMLYVIIVIIFLHKTKNTVLYESRQTRAMMYPLSLNWL